MALLDWMQTYTGKIFHFNIQRVDDFNIEDIAHSLSLQCRFNGHCRQFYSVAEHCIIGSYHADTDIELHFLLHDASEAYLSDVVRGLKRSLYISFKGSTTYTYKEVEDVMQESIYGALGIDPPTVEQSVRIKGLDNRMLATEARDLFVKKPGWDIDHIKPFVMPIIPQPPSDNEAQFLTAYKRLIDERG